MRPGTGVNSVERPSEGAEPGRQTGSAQSHSLAPLAASIVAYAVFRWLLGVVQLPVHTPRPVLVAVGILVAAGAIGLPVWVLMSLVRAGRAALVASISLVVGLALWLGLGVVLPGGTGFFSAGIEALRDLGKILAAGGVGIGLAAALREPNILLPAGVFAAFADFVVVSFGTVKHALSTPKGQALVQSVSAKVPSVHPSLGAGITIGPADFLFLGIFLGCAHRFEMGLARNARLLTIALAATLLLTYLIPAIPALAPMSITFVAANWRQFRLSRSEIISTGVVLLLAGSLFLAFFLMPMRR
jgi:hypothetical protein